MKYSEAAAFLGLEEERIYLWNGWDTSQSSFPGMNLFFLNSQFISEANKILKLSDPICYALYNAIELIKNNEALCRLTWHLHCLMFENEGTNYRTLAGEWPVPAKVMGDLSGMLAAVVFISGVQKVVDFHRERGIPLDVTVDTLSDMDIWINNYHKKRGVWGLDEVSWLSHHFTCRLYRLGRLQFLPVAFNGDIRVFKNRCSSEILAFSEAGVKYRLDGCVNGTNDIYDTENSWESWFESKEGFIEGHPVRPVEGKAVKKLVRIPENEWQQVLAKGDPVLEVHIPEGSRMSHDLCGDSFMKALEFFPKHFPEKPFKGFVCTSWLLDSQFKRILPSESNIVRFQSEFYLYPIRSNDKQTFERVFGGEITDYSAAPRDTQLRRAILDFITEGNHMHSGAGFILKDAFCWGEGYTKMFPGSVL